MSAGWHKEQATSELSQFVQQPAQNFAGGAPFAMKFHNARASRILAQRSNTRG
jgi:hypothetical protein